MPNTIGHALPLPSAAWHAGRPRGTETILLVDDDAAVRRLAAQVLRADGYLVMEAFDGGDAMRIADAYPGEIQLLVSDLAMPRIGGRGLAVAVRIRRPGMRTLFMSGDENPATDLMGTVFLQKPFTLNAIAIKVRAALDEVGGPFPRPVGFVATL